MNERDRRRLLTALRIDVNEPVAQDDPAAALVDQMRAAYHAVLTRMADDIEKRIGEVITEGFGDAMPTSDSDLNRRYRLHTSEAQDPVRARAAMTVIIAQRSTVTPEPRAMIFQAGYEMLAKDGALAFKNHLTPATYIGIAHDPDKPEKGMEA